MELIFVFFEQVGVIYFYKVLDVVLFWKLFGLGKDILGVMYLWNGNLIREYNGIIEKVFSKVGMKKVVVKEWK